MKKEQIKKVATKENVKKVKKVVKKTKETAEKVQKELVLVDEKVSVFGKIANFFKGLFK